MVYSKFASYYDAIYDEICSYEKDVELFLKIANIHLPEKPTSVIDLGCGTGKHLEIFDKEGLEIAGIDLSEEMIVIAKQRFKEKGKNIYLISGNMKDLAIDQTFDLSTSFFGSYGYLIDEKEVITFFKKIKEKEIKLLIFEFWQTTQVNDNFKSWVKVRLDEERELIRISQSFFDEEKSVLRIDFEFFIISSNEVVDRFTEVHFIKTYTFESITKLITEGGCKILGFYKDNLIIEQATENEFRVIVAVKPL
ncbi:MAG: class I SAM-dependent DNA methyltransferase [Candidatus Kariarchaeaceae archaeon]